MLSRRAGLSATHRQLGFLVAIELKTDVNDAN